MILQDTEVPLQS